MHKIYSDFPIQIDKGMLHSILTDYKEQMGFIMETKVGRDEKPKKYSITITN